jgi:hypothetical protein
MAQQFSCKECEDGTKKPANPEPTMAFLPDGPAPVSPAFKCPKCGRVLSMYVMAQ